MSGNADLGISGRRRTLIAVGAAAIVIAPAVVAIARLAGQTMVLATDTADIDLLTRDVFSVHVPLIGIPGRFGFNQPGPLLFYGLAPTNALAGAPWGTQVGGALLQAIAIAWAARLAYRRGGLLLELLVLATLVGTYVAVGSEILLDAWNPNPLVPFATVFVLQVWSVAVGDRWRLVGAVVVGSYLVQTHLLWGPLVAAAFGWLLVDGIFERRLRRATGTAPPWGRTLPVAVTVGVVVWLPALVDELFARGNLSEAIRFTVLGESPHPAVGWRVGGELVAAAFRLPPPWLVGDESGGNLTVEARQASLAWLLVPFGLLVLGLVLARRSRQRDAVRLLSLVGVLGVAAVYAGSRLAHPLWIYLLTPRITVATLLVAATVWTLGLGLGRGVDRRRLLTGVISAAAALAVVAGSTTLAWDTATHPRLEAVSRSTVLAFVPRLERIGPERPVLLRDATYRLTGLFDGLVDELDRAGLPVRVDDFQAPRYGTHRGAALGEVEEVWIVADVGAVLSDVAGLPGARVLALESPLSRREELEIRRIQRRLLTALELADRKDLVGALGSSDGVFEVAPLPGVVREDVERLAELNAKVERSGIRRSAVVALPADSPAAEKAGRPDVVYIL